MVRLPHLLAVSCVGSGLVLLGGRALLNLRPPLTPDAATAHLDRIRRLDPDPIRRREASLLLHAGLEDRNDPRAQRLALRHQGWGSDPLAAVVLKHDALAAEALSSQAVADSLWQRLLTRFPDSPASADALYSLGRRQPALRQDLVQRFAAHPAALAAASEAGPTDAARLEGALHLARWGPRWPGAEDRLRQACHSRSKRLTTEQRHDLARGLAEVGDAEAARNCLKGPPANDATRLALARAQLRGSEDQKQDAERTLALLIQQNPNGEGSEEAVRLLSQQDSGSSLQLLSALPQRWQDTAPVQARRALASGTGIQAVLQRWPGDAASWDLQWEQSRKLLLSSRWVEAATLLAAIPADRMPPPQAARLRFWHGYAQWRQGDRQGAADTWQELRRRHPGGYYGWRAARQLDAGDISLTPGNAHGAERSGWQPLASGDGELDRLWRLDQRLEAWEHWRQGRGNRSPTQSAELLIEGRLRQGVGDDWTGLGQLELASLRLPPEHCALNEQLERSLHPPRFEALFERVALQQDLPTDLLLAVAKQESRFTPAVRSSAGAIGLLQLMPDTAAELAGRRLSDEDLRQPELNASLGGLYLRQLLTLWRNDPVLAVASYNAGPGAVEGWVNARLQSEPELWIESIPYPETRLYVKKVLGNLWSYQQPGGGSCP